MLPVAEFHEDFNERLLSVFRDDDEEELRQEGAHEGGEEETQNGMYAQLMRQAVGQRRARDRPKPIASSRS